MPFQFDGGGLEYSPLFVADGHGELRSRQTFEGSAPGKVELVGEEQAITLQRVAAALRGAPTGHPFPVHNEEEDLPVPFGEEYAAPHFVFGTAGKKD